MKLQSAYLDALDSNDIEKLRRIQLQLEKSTPLPKELSEDCFLLSICNEATLRYIYYAIFYFKDCREKILFFYFFIIIIKNLFNLLHHSWRS